MGMWDEYLARPRTKGPTRDMDFPPRAHQIVEALYALHEPLAKGTEDDRRRLTMLMAQQIRFELGASWGTKSSSPTNPPSKDALVFKSGLVFLAFDWQNGGTREPQRPPLQTDITGQHFIAVDPINHLAVGGDVAPAPTPVAGEDVPIVDWASLDRYLKARVLESYIKLDDLRTHLDTQHDALRDELRQADAEIGGRLAAVEQDASDAETAARSFARAIDTPLPRKKGR